MNISEISSGLTHLIQIFFGILNRRQNTCWRTNGQSSLCGINGSQQSINVATDLLTFVPHPDPIAGELILTGEGHQDWVGSVDYHPRSALSRRSVVQPPDWNSKTSTSKCKTWTKYLFVFLFYFLKTPRRGIAHILLFTGEHPSFALFCRVWL